MTPVERRMQYLEQRDYDSLKVPDHLLHFVKMRDRLAYYSLQLQPFFHQEPWDLPVEVDGCRYPPHSLETLQPSGRSVVEFHDLLTDIEAALIEAAARRGITLHKRGKVDSVGSSSPLPERQRGVIGSALGE